MPTGSREKRMNQLDHALPLHPRTGLRAVGIVAGRPVWPILGASPDGDGGAGGGGDGGAGSGSGSESAGAGSGNGYTAPATQEDLDRMITARVARAVKPFEGFDAIKAKADAHDALELELGSNADKAAAKARDEERAKADGEWTPRLVRAEFKAEAKGVLSDEQLKALLEDLDLSKYVKDGEADTEKIATKIKALAPAGSGGNGKGQHRDLGQGRQKPVDAKPGDQGRAMLARRHPTKAV